MKISYIWLIFVFQVYQVYINLGVENMYKIGTFLDFKKAVSKKKIASVEMIE